MTSATRTKLVFAFAYVLVTRASLIEDRALARRRVCNRSASLHPHIDRAYPLFKPRKYGLELDTVVGHQRSYDCRVLSPSSFSRSVSFSDSSWWLVYREERGARKKGKAGLCVPVTRKGD